MASIRIKRMESELAKIFNYAISFKIRDDRLTWITISKIKLSPDFQYAKVYFTTLDPNPKLDVILKAFSSAKGFFKNEIAKAKIIRTIPELSFHYDDTEEKASKLEEIFKKIAEQKNEQHNEDSGEQDNDES